MTDASHVMPPGASPDLWNDDLAPTTPAQRHWTARSFAALWVGMVACVPTYMLASGLISSGLSPVQAIALIFFGNLIVLIPMLLTGAMGTAYGVPFPVLLRASFGPRGAQIAALARAFVACGWFGINTWIGGTAIYGVVNLLTHDALAGAVLPVLGINAGQLLCFLGFWAVHVYFIARGTESIRWLETLSAPFLLFMGLVLLYWAYSNAHGFGAMLSAPSAFGPGSGKEAQFWPTIAASLTAMVGFWATLSLNICDFTRFSRSQRDQGDRPEHRPAPAHGAGVLHQHCSDRRNGGDFRQANLGADRSGGASGRRGRHPGAGGDLPLHPHRQHGGKCGVAIL